MLIKPLKMFFTSAMQHPILQQCL